MATKNKNPKGQGNGTPRDTGRLSKSWKKMRKGQKAAVILAAIFLVLIGVGAWAYSYITSAGPLVNRPDDRNPLSTDPGAEEVEGTSDSMDELNKWKPEAYYDKNIINFVLMGFDTSDERRDMSGKGWGKGFAGARPDSLRVISIDRDTYTSAVISIPRDTYIQIADTNTKDKINSSYMYGRMAAHNKGITDEEEINKMGLDYVMKTISNVLGGVPMDYYMAVDFDTVVNFVDAIDGVRYDVDITVRHPQTGELMLEKGMQTLNGTQAYIYLQDRTNTSGGDMGRTQHHTMFLKAMMKQLVDSHKLVEALKFVIFDDGMGTVSTNMSVDQIMSAGYIATRLNLTDINPYTVKCYNANMNSTSYVVMDQEERSKLIKKVFDYDFPVQPQEHLVDTVPNPPTNFTAKATSDGVVLDWNPGDVHNKAYNVFRNGTKIANAISEDMYLDSEAPSGALTYEVQAVNGGSVSTKVSATVKGGAGAPTNLKASYDADNDVVHLTWDYSGNADSYTIYRSDGDGTGARYAQKIKNKSFNDSDVVYGKTYTYRVAAVNDGKESAVATVQIKIDTEATNYTLNVAKGGTGSGTTNPSTGAYSETSGAVVTIKATAATGSHFVEWQKSGSVSIADKNSANTTVTVSGDGTVTAIFDKDTGTNYTVTLSVDSGSPDNSGTVSGGGSHAAGTDVTITAKPNTGYKFVKWIGAPVDGRTEKTRTFTMPSQDLTIKALFAEDVSTPTTYAVTVNADPAKGTATGGGNYASGANVTVQATAASGYKFDHWEGSPINGSDDNPKTFTMPASAVTVTAVFVEDTPTEYTVSISCDAAKGSATGGGSYEPGDTVNLTISEVDPSAFVFDKWQGGPVDGTKNMSFTMPSNNVNITAVFTTP